MPTDRTSAAAWSLLAEGNARFAGGAALHPHQEPDRRAALVEGQAPVAAVLGCSDSRVPGEIVFDQGLGDLFTVRNAGQVVSPSAVASLEYAVAALGVPLVVVLGHELCGAVQAAVDAAAPGGSALPPLIAEHVAGIRPAVDTVRRRHPDASNLDVALVGRAHVEATVAGLLAASELISAAVADGSVAVVGAQYVLGEGRAERLLSIGDLDDQVPRGRS